jgi:hypothetical protein
MSRFFRAVSPSPDGRGFVHGIVAVDLTDPLQDSQELGLCPVAAAARSTAEASRKAGTGEALFTRITPLIPIRSGGG